MDIDKGFIALIGSCCLPWPILYILAFRRVNRFGVLLLAASIECFAVAAGLNLWEDYRQGIAQFPARGTTELTRDQLPWLFWFSTIFWWVCVAGLQLMALLLFRIGLMRRRRQA